MSYIYKFEYGGYEGSWHFFMKHKNKYTNEELQKILDNITSNYKLLTALDLIDDWDNDSESFLYLFDDFVNCNFCDTYFFKGRTIFVYSSTEKYNINVSKVK